MTHHPVDTHAHIDSLADPEAALDRAKDQGVSAVVGLGMDLKSNRRILDLTDARPELVWPALGAHPWSLREDDWTDNLDFLKQNLEFAVALGEVGLDYKVNVDKDLQILVFSEVLDLAADLDKPVLIHSRFSQERCLKMLQEAGIKKAVFHWYSGPLDIMAGLVEAGYHVSATPALAYSPPHRAALREAPLDRILVETDCPEAYQGQISEPADVLKTIIYLAELRGLDAETVRAATTRNALNFFQT
jgi:TatD DNase family protein